LILQIHGITRKRKLFDTLEKQKGPAVTKPAPAAQQTAQGGEPMPALAFLRKGTRAFS
jgi:hypothetical protein